jgi:hypothetical protein
LTESIRLLCFSHVVAADPTVRRQRGHRIMKKQWSRSETLALSTRKCAHCRGTGLRFGKRGKLSPCQCVLRRIFRVCYAKFRECVSREKFVSRPSLERRGGATGRLTWSRKHEEYAADFLLVTRRALTERQMEIFRVHYLLGADWRLCVRRFQMEKWAFFHDIYIMEQKLGRLYRELEPYSLFPLDEYFSVSSRADVEPCDPTEVEPEPVFYLDDYDFEDEEEEEEEAPDAGGFEKRRFPKVA